MRERGGYDLRAGLSLCVALAVFAAFLMLPSAARADRLAVGFGIGGYANRTEGTPADLVHDYTEFETRQNPSFSIEAYFGGLIRESKGPRLGLRFRHSLAKTSAAPSQEPAG